MIKKCWNVCWFYFLTGTIRGGWRFPSQLDQEWYCAAKFWSGNQHVLISCCNLQFQWSLLDLRDPEHFWYTPLIWGRLMTVIYPGTGQIHPCNNGNVSRKDDIMQVLDIAFVSRSISCQGHLMFLGTRAWFTISKLLFGSPKRHW